MSTTPLVVFAAVVPTAPQQFNYVTSASGTITVEWEAPQYDGGSPLLGYYIYYKISSVSTWTQTSLISPSASLVSVLGSLTADSQYAMRITAANIKGESIPSGIIYQYASQVPTGVAAPSILVSSRT